MLSTDVVKHKQVGQSMKNLFCNKTSKLC